MALTYEGYRGMVVFHDGPWKVTIDPEEGSTSCECPDHTRWVLDPLTNNRCEHSAEAWRSWLDMQADARYFLAGATAGRKRRRPRNAWRRLLVYGADGRRMGARPPGP